MTVRYPSGHFIRYNGAQFICRQYNGWVLYTADPDKGGSIIALIQLTAGAIVEFVYPCEFSRPADLGTIQRILENGELRGKELRSLKRVVDKLVRAGGKR